MSEYEYMPDEELRFENGITIVDYAWLMMKQQQRIDSGEDVLVEGVGYVPRKLLGGWL